MARKRIGVVGCGLIAQVMHLPYLRELSERFEIAALCDLSPDLAEACARRYGVARTTSDWRELVSEPLDAVLVLTPGNHAPIAVAAAEAGMHVFVEKPMAFSVAEGERMVAACQRAGVRMSVGTMKRYDPAYQRLASLLPAVLPEVRLVRATTLESPLEPYVAHYPLLRPSQPLPSDQLAALAEEEEQLLDAVLGAGSDEDLRWCYRFVLLDNLVHELNMLRGLLGEPTVIEHASLERTRASVQLRFGDVDCHLLWVDLPGIARYSQEVALYAPEDRLTLTLPSPFLRSAPSVLTVEGGHRGTAHSWQRQEVADYDDAFKRELVAFHEAIEDGSEVPTSGSDAIHDLALCEAIARAGATRRPVVDPGDPAATNRH